MARRVWATLIAARPEWAEFFGTCGEDDLELAIPAPVGSNVGHLVVFTAKGKDLWIRFSPPAVCYSVDNETELLDVIDQILAETALFAVVMQGDEWVGTTLSLPTTKGCGQLRSDLIAERLLTLPVLFGNDNKTKPTDAAPPHESSGEES